jgi:predicted DNA-binding protein
MQFAKRDGNQDRQQALSEMEGRMLVLEVVAMTSLALALDTSDPENAKIGRGVLYLIREAVENKCEEMDLSNEAADSAQQYVEELLHTAMATLFPERH